MASKTRRVLLAAAGLLVPLFLIVAIYWNHINRVDSEMLKDVAFATVIDENGKEEVLTLDVYLPDNNPPDYPMALIWFHGGGFARGNDKRQVYIKWLADEFAKRGYVGFSVDYRVRDNPAADLPGTVRDAVSDARRAINWVIEHAEEYGADPQRLVLAGGSAGGVLVANLVHDPEGPITRESGVIGAINLWGPGAGDYRFFQEVSESSPPTLLIHGTEDSVIPMAESEKYLAHLRQAGVKASIEPIQGGAHPPVRDMELIYGAIYRFLKELEN